MHFEFILDQFIQRHEEIDDISTLKKYIKFLLSYDLNENLNLYCEKHHILPVATFPEFKNQVWNLVKIPYVIHVKVHEYLFKAINLRVYQRTLNFMKTNTLEKDTEMLSRAAKRGWKTLKNNPEKYNKWKEARSYHMSHNSFELQTERANEYWKNISNEEYEEFCNNMKDIWTDELKEWQSNNKIEYYKNHINRKKLSNGLKQMWDSRSDEERDSFRKKMDAINKDPEKRKTAGISIKEKWDNKEWRSKMMNRKPRGGTMYKITFPNNDIIIVKTQNELCNTYNISPYNVRKYTDSGIKIDKKHLKDDDTLLGCIIKTYKK